MTPTPEPPLSEEELLRIAEAIADGTAPPAIPDADAASSPGLRHMALIAEAADAFRDAGPAAPAPASGALFAWGPLEVRRALGSGSFGDVYAAWDPRLRREVALKLRRADAPDGARRWLEEARALARVRHPNVLTVYGADEHDGRAGMWTDLVTGRDLEAVLQANGPFSAREAVTIGLELCGALAAVHARGLVHGDVKTRNVMREERGESPGRIVLMDFGSAHESALAVTAGRGTSIGTPLAMAPEVLRGEAATPASDLYSLGVLLFRLVTGRYPFEAATLDELRARHERNDRASLRNLRADLPAAFVAAVEHALAPAPRGRYADAAAMERSLQPLLAGGAPPARARGGLVLAVTFVALLLAVWALRARAPGPARVAATVPAPLVSASSPPAAVAPADTTASPADVPALQADATLYRLRAGEPSPLASGGEIEPGDKLYLDVRAPQATHAYLLDEDGAGHVIVLFPCAGAGERNPLAAGARHRLPGGDGEHALDWLVTSAEGRETFLLVISRKPIRTLEESVAALPQARASQERQYASLDEGDLRHLRGVARMVREPLAHVAAEPGKLASLARALGARDDASDLWIRLVQVDNPKN